MTLLLAAAYWRPADEALTSQLAQFVIGIAVFQFTAGVSAAKETMLVLLSAAGMVYAGLGTGIMASLYSVHVPIGGRIINLAERLPPSNVISLAAILVAGLVSVGAAYGLHRLVERPAQRYAASLHFGGRD